MIIAPRAEINMVSTNVPQVEAGIAVWDSTVRYKLNDVVQVNGTVNRIYKAFTTVPAGVDPTVDVNKTTGVGTYWFDDGATNYARSFDELNSSKCTNADTIEYNFSTSDIDVLMLSGLVAQSVRIVIKNNNTAAVLLDETINTTTREVYDWFDWTVNPYENSSSLFKLLPYTYSTTMNIIIDNKGGIAEVGHIAYGRSKSYGLSLISPNPVASRRSLTTKTRDSYGNIITRRKARYKRMSISCIIDSKSIDIIEDRFEKIVDTPCIFVGDDRDGGYKALLIYGELKDHDMPISVSKTIFKLEVEGYI